MEGHGPNATVTSGHMCVLETVGISSYIFMEANTGIFFVWSKLPGLLGLLTHVVVAIFQQYARWIQLSFYFELLFL